MNILGMLQLQNVACVPHFRQRFQWHDTAFQYDNGRTSNLQLRVQLDSVNTILACAEDNRQPTLHAKCG